MNDKSKKDSESITQPLPNETELDVLRKEAEILRKENMMLKIQLQSFLEKENKDDYKTRELPHPDTPEIKAVKSLLPMGRSLSTQQIANLLQADLSIIQNVLNKLEEKGNIRAKRSMKPAFTPRRPTTYSLTEEGLDYLAKNDLL